MSTAPFSAASFSYFDGAATHPHDRPWFETHRASYDAHVAAPFAALVLRMHDILGDELPDIEFAPKKITRPIRRNAGGARPSGAAGGGPAFLAEPPAVRSNATAFFSIPATSRFEMNPGFYVSIGAREDDNVCGVGLYMPSSRQMKLLRPSIVAEAATLGSFLADPAVRRRWDGLAGERYQRFPKGFDENGPGAAYLWHKQFFLSRKFTRTGAARRDFAASVADDFALAAPFLRWLKETVGVYRSVGLKGD